MRDLVKVSVPPSLQFLKPFSCGEYIRLGKIGDGGYVVPSFIVDRTDCLLSLGLWYEWSFDQHFQKLRPRLTIHGYDYTVSAKELIIILWGLTKQLLRSPRKSHAGLLLHYLIIFKDFIWFWKLRNHFYRQRVISPVEHSYDVTLGQAIERLKQHNEGGMFIKMDIEGSEYSLIDCILKHAGNITGLVIEFHDLHTNREGFVSAVKKLQQEFVIVHLHGNNMEEPDESGFLKVLEITWVKKALLPEEIVRDSVYLPGVDAPNGHHAPDYLIEF